MIITLVHSGYASVVKIMYYAHAVYANQACKQKK